MSPVTDRDLWLRRAAEATALLSLGLVVGAFTFLGLNDWEAGSVSSLVATTGGFFAFSVVGLLIIFRQPRNLVGWICAIVGLASHATGFASEYAKFAYVTNPGSLPSATAVGWFSNWTWVPMVFLPLTQLLLLFPDGRPLSRRWRQFGVGAAALLVALMISASLVDGDGDPPPNPLATPAADVISAILGVAVVPVVLACMVAALLRFRRSTGIQRQQMKWFALAVALNIALQMTNSIVWPEDEQNSLFGIGLLLLAGSIGMSVLRYRLYDIDLVINRALVYGSLTGILAGTYVGSVLLLQLTLSGVTEGSGLAVAASTLAVAALFQPVRARIQRAVDRRFFRNRYNAELIVGAFGSRLRDEVDLSTLSTDLLDTVHTTVRPTHASLWLRSET